MSRLYVEIIEYYLVDLPISKKTLPDERISVPALALIEVARQNSIDSIRNSNFEVLVWKHKRAMFPEQLVEVQSAMACVLLKKWMAFSFPPAENGQGILFARMVQMIS